MDDRGVVVVLSLLEVEQAAAVGVKRRIEAIKRGRTDRYGTPAWNLWGTDIESCGAEMAVAKTLGGYWNALARDPMKLVGDVASGIQVRSTPHRGGSLIVHPKDCDEHVYYLVVGQMPEVRIAGWMLGSKAKKVGKWKRGDANHDFAFWVDQDKLDHDVMRHRRL